VLTAALVAGGCGSEVVKPMPRGYLFEKGQYQGFYGPDGRLIRLLYDQNGDRKADMVTLFYPSGSPRAVEIDTDLDGVVDRWQSFAGSGARERDGWASRKPGVVDVWEYTDPSGRLTRREFDDDANGRIDRIEYYEKGELALVTVDSDQNGKMDRWQSWAQKHIVREELDIDGDGIGDRRLRYSSNGAVASVEKLKPNW
jgi:hypothetical protein